MNVWERWRHRRWLRQAATNIERARRLGHGVHLQEWEHEWQHNFAAPLAGEIEALVEPIIEWCRQTSAGCRRPWGIDYFDLAFACSLGSLEKTPGPARSVSFRRLRPADLYDLGRLRGELAAFISELSHDAPLDPVGHCHVAVALFSWGNAAHAALS